MPVPPAIEIARRATLRPVSEIAAQMGIGPELLEPYGHHVAKVSLDAVDALAGRPRARYVVVTAVTPTPLGEGKTTTTVGLGQALACIGRQATIAIRQASMGPTFGIKGGAAGGGYSQVVPFENLNLHLTGDLHAVTAANNLLAAMVDNHLYNHNPLAIDPHGITWKRVLDVNDRSLRNIVSGLGTSQDGIPRETGFDITAASEVMAVLALARSLGDLRERMGRIVVGYTAGGEPVSAQQLEAAGAMTVIMRDAIKPNLLQTLEHTPVLVHAGPFGNIAHGNSSVVADLIGIHAGDYLVTEAGFGADMGAERFFNIKCRTSGLVPDAAVVVTTVRAMKLHSGRHHVVAGRPLPPAMLEENPEEVHLGAANLLAHLGIVRRHGVTPVVAINAIEGDFPSEHAAIDADRGVRRRARRGLHALRERWQGCRRARRGGRRGGRSRPPANSGCSTATMSHCARRSRPSPRRSTVPTGWTTCRQPRASSTPTSEPASAPCPCASPRPTCPSRRTRSSWAPRGVGACRCGRRGPTWVPGSSMWSAATCAPCPGSRTAPPPSGSTSTRTATSWACTRPGEALMAIDFTLAPEHEEIRARVRSFIQDTVRPRVEGFDDENRVTARREYLVTILELREEAKRAGLWLPHMPKEWGGMGLGHVELAMVQSEAGKTRLGPWILNCMAPDEGNMHTLLHWGTDEQKNTYLRRLCEGTAMSCFAMTEPEVAGSDPTLIQTRAERDGDEWIVNGHKWFISNARRAQFAILVARTEPDVPPGARGANTAFLVDLPAEGWNDVREVETMHGSTGHSEIVIEDLRVHDSQILGGRGNGHRLGQYRLGPARLAHCMRWIAQAETALDMMVDRSLNRFSHGSLLAEKQGVQWLIADSAMELYQCKLMVLHAAYKIDRGEDFRTEVSMAKHFVANSLNRIIDRSMQVHGALGYSTDTPLAGMLQHARWARFADGADEIHQMRIAERTIAAYKDTGSTASATGGLPL